jgi:hypothetical protein
MATDTDIRQGLLTVLAYVPNVKTVTSGVAYRISRRGGVLPLPADCPTIRVSAGAVRLRPWTLQGAHMRHQTWYATLWAFEDDPTLSSDAWEQLRADVLTVLELGRRTLISLTGILDVQVDTEQQPRRPLGAPGNRGLLQSEFALTTWEQI